jgi:hypothetical protein
MVKLNSIITTFAFTTIIILFSTCTLLNQPKEMKNAYEFDYNAKIDFWKKVYADSLTFDLSNVVSRSKLFYAPEESVPEIDEIFAKGIIVCNECFKKSLKGTSYYCQEFIEISNSDSPLEIQLVFNFDILGRLHYVEIIEAGTPLKKKNILVMW